MRGDALGVRAERVSNNTHQSEDRRRWREAWLEYAIVLCREYFAERGYTIPEKVRCTCGWPSRSALATKKRRIGECWSLKSSEDGTIEMFISPLIAQAHDVLPVLVHELVHAVVGVECGHKGRFIECAKAVGLERPWTATSAGSDLAQVIRRWIQESDGLGRYPHAPLTANEQPRTQTTRMLKMECPDCGCIVRTTRVWLETHGTEWPCPCGGKLYAVSTEKPQCRKDT
jgi:hypothetical protein